MPYLFLFVHLAFAAIFGALVSPYGIVWAVLFTILGVFVFMYFHPAFNFIGVTIDGAAHSGADKHQIKAYVTGFLRQQTYYLAFLTFYLSLFGISYSFHQNYPLLTFSLSTIIVVTFASLYRRSDPIIFLLFRSNFITFTIIHAGFVTYMFATDTFVEHFSFFVVNSIYSLAGLIAIVAYDTMINGYIRRRVYGLALAYMYLLLIWGFHILIPNVSSLDLASMLGIAYGILLAAFARYIPRLEAESDMAESVGKTLMQASSLGILVRFVVGGQIMDIIISLLIVAVVANAWLYRRDNSTASLVVAVLIVLVGYVELIAPHTVDPAVSIVLGLIFTYVLPVVLVGITYVLSNTNMRDIYFLHSTAVIFIVGTYGTYLVRYPTTYHSILVASLFLMPFSLVLFFTYIRYQK